MKTLGNRRQRRKHNIKMNIRRTGRAWTRHTEHQKGASGWLSFMYLLLVRLTAPSGDQTIIWSVEQNWKGWGGKRLEKKSELLFQNFSEGDLDERKKKIFLQLVAGRRYKPKTSRIWGKCAAHSTVTSVWRAFVSWGTNVWVPFKWGILLTGWDGCWLCKNRSAQWK
jgi:hypothetical protein